MANSPWPYDGGPKLPAGCDLQGRYPEAAHAASEFDADSFDAPPDGAGLVMCVALCLAVWAIVALVVVVVGGMAL
jgi:hypothetical protein